MRKNSTRNWKIIGVLYTFIVSTMFLALGGITDKDNTAVFQPYEGHYLQGSAIATYVSSSDMECSHRCSLTPQCRSFNMENRARLGAHAQERACELNSGTLESRAHPDDFAVNSRMTYYERVIFMANPANHTSNKTIGENFYIDFPRRSTKDYVRLRDVIVKPLGQFTLCAQIQLFGADQQTSTIFSYAVAENSKEIFFAYNGLRYEAEVQGHKRASNGRVWYKNGDWHHACLSWNQAENKLLFYHDAALIFEPSFPVYNAVRSRGLIILGQNQESGGGNFKQEYSLSGRIAALNLWSRVLTKDDIRGLGFCYKCTGCPKGDVLSWPDVKSRGEIRGQASIMFSSVCQP